MGAGFSKEKDKQPDGFDTFTRSSAYQMVPHKGEREFIVSSDHREWTLTPAGKWRGDVTLSTGDQRVKAQGKNTFTIPAQASITFKVTGNTTGPAHFSLETAGAPAEAQHLMISVLPTRRRDITISSIKFDMFTQNPMSRSEIFNQVSVVSKLYLKQANVELIDSQGYVDEMEFPLENLGDPIILGTYFKLRMKKHVGAMRNRVSLIYGWDFEEDSDPNREETVRGDTFPLLGLCFVDTRRDTLRQVASTTAHELGHAFDLGHEDNDQTNIMAPGPSSTKIRFNARQIEALNGFNPSLDTLVF